VLNGVDNFPALEKVGDIDAHMFTSSPSGGSESMHLMYLMTIAAADKTIDLEAAYFIPDDLITQAFLAARKRGVRIRVLVPGKNTDSDAARHASKADWGRCCRPASRSTNTNPPCSTTRC
jgi:cardiolipin synthase